MGLKFKKGEKVVVTKGKDKNKQGVIEKVFPKSNKVLIPGVNLQTHFVKPNQENPQGAVIKKEAPIDLSNVMHLDPRVDVPTRISRKQNKDGQWIKFSKKSNEEIVV